MRRVAALGRIKEPEEQEARAVTATSRGLCRSTITVSLDTRRMEAGYRARRGRGCKKDLPGIPGRGEPRTDWEKPGGRRYPDSGREGKMATGDVEENITE